MRALVQRVSRASVTVGGEVTGEIGPGLLVLLGVSHEDTEEDADRICHKLRNLRIFEDADGRMNEPLGARIIATAALALELYHRGLTDEALLKELRAQAASAAQVLAVRAVCGGQPGRPAALVLR